MSDYPALNDDASPFDSLARAKLILRQSTERAVMERRRKEQQRGLQSSMLEYTEHARRVRKAHVEHEARGSLMRDPTFAARLEAALDVKPRKGRSPVRASEGELRRLYGNLNEEKIKALEEKHLPEILQTKPTDRPGKQQRGEGTDFWDIVTKDGKVKRIVVLRADDKFVNTRCREPGDDGPALRTTPKSSAADCFMCYRSDGSNYNSNLPGENPGVRLPKADEARKSTAEQTSVRPGMQDASVQVVKKPVLKIEVSIPRMEFDTPSPGPSEPEEGGMNLGGGLWQNTQSLTRECSHSELRNHDDTLYTATNIAASRGRDRQENLRDFPDAKFPRVGHLSEHYFNPKLQSSGLQNEQSMSSDGGCSSSATSRDASQATTVLRMPSQIFPLDTPRCERTRGQSQCVEIRDMDGQHCKTDLPMHGVSQSSLSLDDTLSYHRGFTVNTSVQTLPSRMEGILKNAMSSAQRDPSRLSESTGGGADTGASGGAVTCRHGQLVSTCTTCRTVDEIQRRLKTNHFRRQMRQSFQWNLQAGTALSNSSRWDGGGSVDRKINLVPRLKEMRAQKKKSSVVLRQKKSGKAKSGLQKVGGSFMKRSVERSGANSSLKNSSESLGAKKSVRFSEENVYHRMTGYYPTKDAENIVSAS